MNTVIRPGLADRNFECSDQDISDANYQYYGFVTQDANWIIERFDLTVSNQRAYRFATVDNNPGYSSYPAAYAARASLVYDYYYVVNI